MKVTWLLAREERVQQATLSSHDAAPNTLKLCLLWKPRHQDCRSLTDKSRSAVRWSWIWNWPVPANRKMILEVLHAISQSQVSVFDSERIKMAEILTSTNKNQRLVKVSSSVAKAETPFASMSRLLTVWNLPCPVRPKHASSCKSPVLLTTSSCFDANALLWALQWAQWAYLRFPARGPATFGASRGHF